MYQDVVQPLLTEVRSKTEQNKSLKKDLSIAKHDLKLLNACIRVPSMCEFFQKAVKRRTQKEVQTKLNSKISSHLKRFDITDKNQKEFFDKYVQYFNC